MIALWSIAVVVALLVGVACGYLLALLRTPAVLSKMTPAQLAATAAKTAERRKHAPPSAASQ